MTTLDEVLYGKKPKAVAPRRYISLRLYSSRTKQMFEADIAIVSVTGPDEDAAADARDKLELLLRMAGVVEMPEETAEEVEDADDAVESEVHEEEPGESESLPGDDPDGDSAEDEGEAGGLDPGDE